MSEDKSDVKHMNTCNRIPIRSNFTIHTTSILYYIESYEFNLKKLKQNEKKTHTLYGQILKKD